MKLVKNSQFLTKLRQSLLVAISQFLHKSNAVERDLILDNACVAIDSDNGDWG